MREKNFFTINQLNEVELHGFEMIEDFMYIEILNKNNILLIAHEVAEERTHRIIVNKNRTITDKKIIEIIKNGNFINKRFIADENMKNYLSTSINI